MTNYTIKREFRFTVLTIVLSSVIAVVSSQLIYPDDVSFLEELTKPGLSQDQIAEALYQSLSHVTPETIIQSFKIALEHRWKHIPRNDSPDLRFESEASIRESLAQVNIEPECISDVTAYVQHVSTSRWAQKMVDATGKPGAGILSGRFMFLGDFDECRAVQADYSSSPVETFTGQYCLGNYKTKLLPMPTQLKTSWAFCLPDSCNDMDSLQLAAYVLKQLNVTAIEFDSMRCHRNSISLNNRAVGAFVMLGVILILVLLGTFLDILLIQSPKWRVSDEVREDLGGLLPEAPFQYPPRGRRQQEDWHVGRSIEADPLILNNNHPALTAVRTHQPMWVRLLLAFSAWTNAEKLIQTDLPSGSLTCLNGIRVISINWVVLGHTVLFIARNGENVVAYTEAAVKRWSFQTIINGTFSVDTFFVLSGVLVSYVTLSNLKKTHGKINWLKFYIHRYLRLTPVYMIIMALYLGTLPFLFNGPLYDQKNGFERDPHCKNSWWGNPLYIQNLVRFKPYFCMAWSWYLAVDMQFYILSPVLLIPLYHRPKLGYFVVSLFLIATTVTPLALTETRKYPSGIFAVHLKGHPTPLGDSFYDIYISPYSRMGPYLIGLLTGHILSRRRNVRIPGHLIVIGWMSALATGLACVYGLSQYFKGTGMNLHAASIYNGLSRTAWGISVAWVIFSCVTGTGGVINTFLSWSVWVPLSKLTYVVYLIHVIVLDVLVATARTPVYASNWSIAILYIATLSLTYAFAFICSVLFEAPGLVLEKLLFRPSKKQ